MFIRILRFILRIPDYWTLNMAAGYLQLGNKKTAESIYRQGLARARKKWGEDDPVVIIYLTGEATAYKKEGNFANSKNIYCQCLTIAKNKLAEKNSASPTQPRTFKALMESPLTASFWKEQVISFQQEVEVVLFMQGHYEAAKRLCQDSLTLLGIENPESLSISKLSMLKKNELLTLQTILMGLENIYLRQANPDKAIIIANQSSVVQKYLFGEDSPAYTAHLWGVGQIYLNAGYYEDAEKILLEVVTRQKREKVSSLQLPSMLLANLYMMQGELSKAQTIYQDLINNSNKIIDYANNAWCLNGLARIAFIRGDLEEAKKKNTDALEKLNNVEGIFGETDYLIKKDCLYTSALISQSELNFEEAEQAIRESLEITRKLCGKNSPQMANHLMALGNIEYAKNLPPRNYESSKIFYDQAVELLENTCGEDHPDVEYPKVTSACLSMQLGQYSEGFGYFEKVLFNKFNNLHRLFPNGYNFRWLLNSFLYAGIEVIKHESSLKIKKEITATCYQAIINRKGLGFSFEQMLSNAINNSNYSQSIIKKIEELRQTLNMLTKAYYDFSQPSLQSDFLNVQREGQVPDQVLSLTEHINTLTAKINNLEFELFQEDIKEIEQYKTIGKVTVEQVADKLPKNATLVDFFQFNSFNVQEQKWEQPHYIVFIIQGQDSDSLILEDLGIVSDIDQEISQLSRQFSEQPQPHQPRNMGSLDSYNNSEPTHLEENEIIPSFLQFIKEKLVNKIESHHFYISPDGQFNLLPFHLLPELNQHSVSYLTSARELFNFSQEVSHNKLSPPFLMVNPDYQYSKDLTIISTSTNLEPVSLTENPFAKNIQQTFNLTDKLIFSQENANEFNYLNQQQSPVISIIATHGFFTQSQTEDRVESSTPTFGKILGQTLGSNLSRGKEEKEAMDHPMNHSQLALAGYNYSKDRLKQDTKELISKEDIINCGKGFVTGKDIAEKLNLHGTQIKIVIACVSGIGNVVSGEGVMGMRQAFMIAGVQTLLVSLWHVPQSISLLLIQKFIDYLYEPKISRLEALRKAQKYISEATVKILREDELGRIVLNIYDLENNPDDDVPFAHPWYWGAWILQGNPAPLSVPLNRVML